MCDKATNIHCASKVRNYGVDLLRGIAAFGIVGRHLSLTPVTNGGAVQHFCDFNVAVFAVVAGMLMGGDGDLAYVLKRVKRIAPTYLAWSAIFVVASVGFQMIGGGAAGRFGDFKYWLSVLFRGNASCHLWFLVCLLYAQVAISFVGRYVPRWAWLLVGVLFVCFASCGETWYHLYLMRLFGFVCVGRGLDVLWNFAFAKRTTWLFCLSVLMLAAHVFLAGIVPDFICDLMAVAPVVLLFKSIGEKSPSPSSGIARFATFLASTSMAVFLVHPIFTRLGSCVVGKLCPTPYSASVVLLDWTLCWLLALGFAVIAIRIPYVRRVCQ